MLETPSPSKSLIVLDATSEFARLSVQPNIQISIDQIGGMNEYLSSKMSHLLMKKGTKMCMKFLIIIEMYIFQGMFERTEKVEIGRG